LIALAIIIHFKILIPFLLFWFVPATLAMPWVELMNSYQHYSKDGPQQDLAYNVVFKNKWIQELLFPLNISYHDVHHQHPYLPFHELPNQPMTATRTFQFKDFSKRLFNSQTNINS
jgi:fatty acid desaturase